MYDILRNLALYVLQTYLVSDESSYENKWANSVVIHTEHNIRVSDLSAISFWENSFWSQIVIVET